ncbi:CHAP domain-containing protein [Nonomuraea sp. MG754425]|uniref:CHAP domain-containing protein n=1 Tax=Nonomuraea sp. MG754425 TaxID=2570319 RepID=UPI001F426B48|nr:CHAP domain-containing protein [Nonomuraea sp. MG754425]MCF6472070.1 CHAP domain-containing protein [Nonomuraea sp. MG754425]
MTPEIQKYIELLESQLGYSERSGSYTKFGNWYGKNVEFDADYSAAPWCDMYLSWAAHKLGYEEWIGQFAWTVEHAKWFKEQGAWGKTPKVGALVFYDWSGSHRIDNIDHVGIVTRVEGGRIHTIEGNIDGGVAKRKERDTSKVVGYGYPERVKARLDRAEAKKKAKEQAKEQIEGDVGTLQLPGESLSSMIPQGEVELSGRTPLATGRIQSQDPTGKQTQGKGLTDGQTPEEAQGRTQDGQRIETSGSAEAKPGTAAFTAPSAAPSTGASTGASTKQPGVTRQSPQSSAAPSPGAVKKGKHAKPATADTETATAEPLPSHTDTSVTGPLPVIESPTLIGSALVAALALLAVAKTRRLRLSPVAVAAVAGKPVRPSRAKGRRRRRRGAAPVVSPAVSPAVSPVMSPAASPVMKPAVSPVVVPDVAPVVGPAVFPAFGGVPAAGERRRPLDTTKLPDVVELQESAERLATSAALRALSTTGQDRHAATRRAAGSGGARHRKLPLETRPFDLTTDAPHGRGRHSTGHRRRHATGATPFTPAFDSEPFEPDFDPSRFAFTDQTAPLERITIDDETGPLEVVLDTGPLRRVVDTGPFERIVIPGASSTFDAFMPPRGRRGDVLASPAVADYRGRRRRVLADEHSAFSPVLPPRGRRHRRPHTDDTHHLVTGGRHRA